MVRLTRIYTRGGDKGKTSLGNGVRVEKDDQRVAAYGGVDELNAALGIVRAALTGNEDFLAMVARIQNDLFDLGADLCVPEDPNSDKSRLRIVQDQVDRLEEEIDAMNAKMEPLNSFILPGGSIAAAHVHMARALARRAERDIVTLMRAEAVNPLALAYINRLSDHLFVLSRAINTWGSTDILWQPGESRRGT